MSETYSGRTAVVITSHPGSVPAARRREEEEQGRRPRRPPTEVAARLGADVIDVEWLERAAHPLARLIARRFGVPAGQIAEIVLRHRRYAHVCAWADRIGLPLAALFKLLRVRSDLTMVSVDLLGRKKAPFLTRLRVHTHLRAIQTPSTVQLEAAVRELGVPREQLVFAPNPVDQQFWRSRAAPSGRRICAVGWEARDYRTLLEAVRDLDVEVHVAVGTMVFTAAEQGHGAGESSGPVALAALRGTAGYASFVESMRGVTETDLARAVWHQQLEPTALRELYEQSLLVVVPLHDVPFDAGATVIQEAMAMGRPVIATRTRGQVDMVVGGETGSYVPPGDAAALRAVLGDLLDRPQECARMGSAGRARALEAFDFDRFVRQTAGLVAGTWRPGASAG